jgi:hypothetical protein
VVGITLLTVILLLSLYVSIAPWSIVHFESQKLGYTQGSAGWTEVLCTDDRGCWTGEWTSDMMGESPVAFRALFLMTVFLQVTLLLIYMCGYFAFAIDWTGSAKSGACLFLAAIFSAAEGFFELFWLGIWALTVPRGWKTSIVDRFAADWESTAVVVSGAWVAGLVIAIVHVIAPCIAAVLLKTEPPHQPLSDPPASTAQKESLLQIGTESVLPG